MGSKSHDVVIIGAGIAGVSTAYFLAKAGHDVCVVERNTIGLESTGRSAGIIGQAFRPPPGLSLAMRSVELWKMLAAESDLHFEFRQQGQLKLAWNEKHAADLKAALERERAAGLDGYFLSRAETRERFPTLLGPYVGSVFFPSDGSAEPYLACLALARAARRYGAVIHEHCEVIGIEVTHGRVCGVLTTSGPIAAGVVVSAAGAWSPVIGRMVGVQIPAEVRRSHLIVTERLPRVFEAIVSTDFYGYFRQTASGNVLIGYPARPVEGFDRRATFDAVRVAAVRGARIVPSLKGASLIRAFTGFTTWTPDLSPIIGSAGPTGFYVATAFCGRGFAVGPAVGELMAELITNGRTSLPIGAYGLHRFEQTPGQVADLTASRVMTEDARTEGREA